MEKQEFEKKFSRKKLVPHYFFNILELIRGKTNNNRELLNKVKFILYYFLVDAEQEKIELDKELDFYKYYIELEKLRHKEKISVNFSVLGKTENILILPLLFEPLIGNAMKYTIKDDTGWVDIIINTTCFPVLSFCCKNNYSQFLQKIVSSESGLKILRQRLELCYFNKHTLNIIKSDDFYEVTLSIELE
jgi:LytS/YehU family sensor histidine kinase